MIWRPTLALSGSILLVALLAAAMPVPPASAQEQSTQERLDRLERDLSMLQRQVYSRAGAFPYRGSGSNTAVDIEIRMERLEQQMRDLTGRVESAMNEVERLRQRIEQIDSDIGMRLGQSGQPPRARTGRVGGPTAATAPTEANAGPTGMPESRGLTPPPTAQGGSTLTPPTAPMPQTADTGAGSRPALPSGSASAQYNFAFGLLKAADYPAAERALRTFVRQHPDEALAGNAQYWLGETYYVRRRYADAATAFAEGYRRYPKGSKAPDELLKLGMSLARADQRKNACVAFAELARAFPHARAAIRERAAAEKKQAGC